MCRDVISNTDRMISFHIDFVITFGVQRGQNQIEFVATPLSTSYITKMFAKKIKWIGSYVMHTLGKKTMQYHTINVNKINCE